MRRNMRLTVLFLGLCACNEDMRVMDWLCNLKINKNYNI